MCPQDRKRKRLLCIAVTLLLLVVVVAVTVGVTLGWKKSEGKMFMETFIARCNKFKG